MIRGKHNVWILMLAALIGAIIAISDSRATISYSDLLAQKRPLATRQLAYGKLPDQFGELWLPDKPGPYPVVVMLHGGCWLAALPGVELMAYIAEDLRKSGFAVWNMEYRRLGTEGAGYPGTFLDVANGIDYLRNISERYQLDLTRVITIGHSAGGHLALWAAARRKINAASPLHQSQPLPVRAAVTLAGINDLEAYRNNGPSFCGGPATIDQLVNAKEQSGRDYYADTSPAAMLPIGVAQMIVSGDSDPIVPPRFGKDYAIAAKNSGDRVELVTIANAGHFELIDPNSKAWTRIKSSLVMYLK